jgi:4-amino-4-deoxy-L-arabinose transferase-like glycosyltransferase
MSISTRTIHIPCILLLALASYLIGNERVSLWDRDEPRYAQTSRQMLRSGDWVVPRLYDHVRKAKPVLIYWGQATCMRLLGDTAAAARLPSAIAITLTLALLVTSIGGRRGFWTMLILASSLLVFWAAKSALTDAVLLLFITISQLCLYAIWRGNRSWWVVVIMAIAIGLGGLTKGPIVIAIPIVTLIALRLLSPRPVLRERVRVRALPDGAAALTPALSRSTGRGSMAIAILKSLVGVGVLIAVVGPWCYLVEQRCPGFLTDAFRHEVIDRSTNPQEGHSGPPGYYLLTIWPMFFPWSLLLPATLMMAWRNRRLPHIRFALAAVIGPWIMLELVRTKLPHYLLPAYPFLAFLTADLLIRAGRKRVKGFFDPGFVRIVAVWAGIVALVGVAPWIAMRWFPFNRAELFGLLVLTMLTAEYARNVYTAIRAGRPLVAAGVMGIGMFILVIVLHVGFLPAANFLQVSRQTAAILKANDATTPGDEIMIDYKEPSLAFYQGGTIREESRDDYLTTVDPIFWPRWIVVTDAVFKKTPEDRKQLLEEIGSVAGWDYAGKGVVEVKVLKRAD